MPDPIKPPDAEPTWDVVDEGSWESFPASDPPSWSQHRVVADPADADPVDKLPDVTSPHYAAARRRRRLILGGVALALAGLGAAGLIARRISGRVGPGRVSGRE